MKTPGDAFPETTGVGIVPKWIELIFERCHPERCDPASKSCAAARSCKARILVQEEPGDKPMQLFRELCRGCRDCMRACPLEAIR